MRQYPRRLYKGTEKILVTTTIEEYQAGLDGFESHWDKEINEKRKGTDKEILRVNPNKIKIPTVVEIAKVEEKKVEPKKLFKKSKKDS